MAAEEKSIDQALGRFLDGEPEPQDAAALAQAMAADAQFAEELRRLLAIDGLLHQTADADPAAFADSISTSIAAEDDGAQFTQAVSNRLTSTVAGPAVRRRWLPWFGAVAVCIAAALGGIWLGSKPPPQQGELVVAAVPVAVMVNEANARFAANASPSDKQFAPGTYQLEAGTVHIRFASGAEVVMRSPARFTVIDRMNMGLTEGALRAVVPSSATGFSVHAADVRYEDFGTEFGVAVGKKPGESQLHVFEGRVDLKTPQGKLLSSVEVGESVRVTGGKVEPMDVGPVEQFPTAATIGQEKSTKWQERLEKDRSLVCYFPFMQDAADRTLLKDHAANEARLDGRIAGARWVTGRWPGKQALLFDRDGDHVKLEIPGEHRQLTVAAWIYLDRRDFALNAILNSDSWRPGALHFQMSRTGNLLIGHWAKKPQRKQLGPHVPLGRWTHVAAVADLDGLMTKTYIDGELAEKVKLASFPGSFKPGSCRIGDWFPDKDPSSIPRRGFRGRIDELAVWRRAISQDEVREMVSVGRSSLASID